MALTSNNTQIDCVETKSKNFPMQAGLSCWNEAGCLHGFMLLRFSRPGWIFIFFTVFICPVLVNLCPLQPQRSVLVWQEWNQMWFSTVVAHPPQTSTCRTRFCPPQLVIWVTVVFLSALSSLTSKPQTRHFCSFFGTVLIQSETLLSHTPSRSKSLRSSFLFLFLMWTLTEAPDVYLPDCMH